MAKFPSENTNTLRYFRKFLEAWMQRAGINKTVAAERLGIGQSQLNEILNEKRGASIFQLEKMCHAMNINIVNALSIGRGLCGENESDTKLTPRQIEAIEAFKFALICGGEAAEMLAKYAIDLAEKKRAEAASPTENHKHLKSA